MSNHSSAARPDNDPSHNPPRSDGGQINRRTLLGGALAAGVAAAGGLAFLRPAGAQPIGPGSKIVADTDRERPRSGRVTTLALAAASGTVDLAGRTANSAVACVRVGASRVRRCVCRLKSGMSSPAAWRSATR